MSGIPISSKCLFSLNISIFVRNENSKNWPDGVLVHRCINSRVTTLAVYAIAALVCAPLRAKRVPLAHRTVSQRCHRIAFFLRLALTQTSGTDYFKINATMY